MLALEFESEPIVATSGTLLPMPLMDNTSALVGTSKQPGLPLPSTCLYLVVFVGGKLVTVYSCAFFMLRACLLPRNHIHLDLSASTTTWEDVSLRRLL